MPRERFERIVGVGNVLYRSTDLLAYSYDASLVEMIPGFVVFPHETTQVHQLILYCNRIKKPFVIRGRGSGHQGGCLGKDALIIDMSRFNTVSTVENDIITVDAGVGVAQLQQHLAKIKKGLPWDFAYGSTMSVGGLLAINPLHKYSSFSGRVSSDVVEVTAFDATGKLYTCRGKDMDKFLGTEGRLGIIISVKLKLQNPLSREGYVEQFDDVTKLLSAVGSLREDDDVVSLELLDKRCSEMFDLGNKYTLIFETKVGVKKKSIGDKVLLRKAKRAREQVSSVLKSQGYIHEEDSMVSVERLREFFLALEQEGRPYYGHVGLGIIHTNYKKSENCNKLYSLVAKLGGECGAQFGYGLLKAKYTPIQTRNMIKRLLETHNPHDFLNPGKMIRDIPGDEQ